MKHHGSPEEEAAETLKRSLGLVLPGAILVLLGSLITLGIGLMFLVEGAPLIRAMLPDIAQPFRSILYFVLLATPMVILCWCGRRGMGYLLSHINKSHRDQA